MDQMRVVSGFEILVHHGSVLLRQRNGQDAGCLRGIARILAAPCSGRIVVVDLPEDLPPAVIERAKVVLAVGVVAVLEILEAAHLGQHLHKVIGRKARNPGFGTTIRSADVAFVT